MASAGLSVGVVGGGIGGLSAALSLLHAGFDVHVFEAASTLGEVGAGVQVSPNASRLLLGLGLGDGLARTGVKPLAFHQRRWDDGRTLLRSPLGDSLEAVFGFPHYQMHRADLLSVLADAVPAERVHLGHRVTGLADHGDRVEVRFAGGATAEVDVLVGADGIHSAVRGELFGPERPRFTGCVAYRGLVPAERVRELRLEVTGEVWMGPGRHLVHYFVRDRRLVNVVAVVEQDTWTRESWTDRGDIVRARAAFDGWHPHVRQLLEAVDATFTWALFDRAPLERWSAGRVTLLGDACHAMLPFMAQGAAQAIEDGATLAACLREAGSDLPAALRRYERLRIPRTSRMQALSAANKTRFHLPDGPLQRERDAQMATGTTDFTFQAVAWIYEHDAAVVHEPADERANTEQAEIDAEVAASGADGGAPPVDTTGRDDAVHDARVWWRRRAANLSQRQREVERSSVERKSRADERDRRADERDHRADQRDEEATTRDRMADERDREADQREIDAEAAVSSTDDAEGHGSRENAD